MAVAPSAVVGSLACAPSRFHPCDGRLRADRASVAGVGSAGRPTVYALVRVQPLLSDGPASPRTTPATRPMTKTRCLSPGWSPSCTAMPPTTDETARLRQLGSYRDRLITHHRRCSNCATCCSAPGQRCSPPRRSRSSRRTGAPRWRWSRTAVRTRRWLGWSPSFSPRCAANCPAGVGSALRPIITPLYALTDPAGVVRSARARWNAPAGSSPIGILQLRLAQV